MAKTLVGALALAALPSALAFRDTSPFFLYSTADSLHLETGPSIASSSQVKADVLQALRNCPTRNYFLVEQLGVSSDDFLDERSNRHLSWHMGEHANGIKTKYSVPQVAGKLSLAEFASHLNSKCSNKTVHERRMGTPASNKAQRLRDLFGADQRIDNMVTNEYQSDDYTVIYVTSPVDDSVAKALLQEEHPPYEMDHQFGDYEQLELKRDLSSHAKQAKSANAAGLFERYQYFTPGLFMAFSTIIPLFLILLVGIRALTSLQVSYFAFSKEMGPNAQKKQ